ncbi:Hypothetical predicted protein [Olea europaea subsp. europaea]|uniref:Uncharacterized protein n=1 Tax=Olea europaea subsp. europaea TaxID=158383 RepID=A0A8S0TIK1_OLEEU|nr:Hypothetical predicted protein [Olea europaea subsp. europaea]
MRDEIAHHVIVIIEPMRSSFAICKVFTSLLRWPEEKLTLEQRLRSTPSSVERRWKEVMSGTDCRNMTGKYKSKWSTVETNLPEGEPNGKIASDDERRKYYRVNNLEGSEVNVFDQLRAVLFDNWNDGLNTFNMSDTILNGWRDGSGGDHRWDGGPRDRGSVANPRMEDVPKRKGVASMIDELASLETKEGMAYSGWRTWWIRRGCPL